MPVHGWVMAGGHRGCRARARRHARDREHDAETPVVLVSLGRELLWCLRTDLPEHALVQRATAAGPHLAAGQEELLRMSVGGGAACKYFGGLNHRGI